MLCVLFGQYFERKSTNFFSLFVCYSQHLTLVIGYKWVFKLTKKLLMQKCGKLQNVQQLIKYRILFIDCHMVSLKTFTLFMSLCCIGIYILISVFRLIEQLLYASLYKHETTESLCSSEIILLKLFFGHKSNRLKNNVMH